MRLSTRGRYGVKAMIDLAMRYGKGPVPLKEIADRQRLSEHYLEQLVASLRRAGLVVSVRGAQGGYELARPPEQVSIGDVVRILEGPIGLVDCLEHGDACCDQTAVCMTRSVWRRLRDSMEEVLNSTTLKDVVDEAAGSSQAPPDAEGSVGMLSLGCPSTSQDWR